MRHRGEAYVLAERDKERYLVDKKYGIVLRPNPRYLHQPRSVLSAE